MVGYKVWKDHRDITDPKEFEATGYDRETMKRSWEFLDQTSRSFAMVIKELEGELARVVSCTNVVTCQAKTLTPPRSRSSTSFSARSTRLRTT